MTAAFDLDGTLFHHDPSPPKYDDPLSLSRSTQPIAERCAHVRRLIEAGDDVHFITGRGSMHAGHTLEALQRHIHPNVRAAGERETIAPLRFTVPEKERTATASAQVETSRGSGA